MSSEEESGSAEYSSASQSEEAKAAAAPVEFKVNVKSLTGNTNTIAAHGALTVKELKQRVQDQTGIPPDQQRLLFNGRQLSNKSTLDAAGVKAESTLHLVLRLRPAAGEDDSGDDAAAAADAIAPTTAASHPKKGLKRREGDLEVDGGPKAGALAKRAKILMAIFRVIGVISGALAIAMIVIGSIALADGADTFECAYDQNIGLALWLVVWSAFLIAICIVTSMCTLFNRDRQTAYVSSPPAERARLYPEMAMFQRVNNCVGCFLCAWMIVGIVILASVAPVCMEAYEPLWALSVVALAMVGFTCLLTCVVATVVTCFLMKLGE